MQSNRAPRRRHAPELKAQVLRDCNEPGASVAAVAQAHGLNANLVHKWRRGRGAGPLLRPSASSRGAATPAGFVALTLPPMAAPSQAIAATPACIRIEIQRGALAIGVHWPAADSAQCAAWLHQLLATTAAGKP